MSNKYLLVEIFKKHGFTIWGGNWHDPIDYQHFQPPRTVAKMLGAMSSDDARHFFKYFVQYPKLFSNIEPDDERFIIFYGKYPKLFIKILKENQEKLDGMDVNSAYDLMKSKILPSNN